MKNILRYCSALVVVFIAAALASFFTSSQVSAWYASLDKPSFTPPNSAFALVWALLYVCMALALARVWNLEESAARRKWLFTFAFQLALNILWSILFFGLHGLLTSVIDIVILWFAIVVLTLDSWELDRVSFWLLVPYLAWSTFALILNVAIWWIN